MKIKLFNNQGVVASELLLSKPVTIKLSEPESIAADGNLVLFAFVLFVSVSLVDVSEIETSLLLLHAKRAKVNAKDIAIFGHFLADPWVFE